MTEQLEFPFEYEQSPFHKIMLWMRLQFMMYPFFFIYGIKRLQEVSVHVNGSMYNVLRAYDLVKEERWNKDEHNDDDDCDDYWESECDG